MKSSSHWQHIAERLAESGWSWKHSKLSRREKHNLHVAEARNDDGHTHAVVAESIKPAFAVLEQSIQSIGE
jgi:hypothetical protein